MKSIALMGLAAVLVIACDPTNNIIDPQQQNNANSTVTITQVFSKLRSFGMGDRGGMGGLFSAAEMSRRAADHQKHMQFRTAEDSTGCEGDHDWGTCAAVTETLNEDGSYTIIYDFGTNGCYDEEEEEVLYGKIEEIWYEDEAGNFSATITFTDFGGEDWTINGTESWSGHENYDEVTDTDEGYAEFSEDLVIVEETETYTIVGSGRESWDNVSFTVESADYTVGEQPSGETYSSSVTTPLYFSYACEEENDTWIFVSGVEEHTWTDGSAVVDFGDGTCDNIITVTENGETIEIDLDEEEDEDDGDDDD